MSDIERAPKGTRNSNRESSIYQDPNGRWHGWVTMGSKPNGDPDRRHRTGKTRKAVVTKVKQLERERDTGVFAQAGSSMTVEAWLSHWIRDIAPVRMRRKTVASCKTDVDLHLIPGLGKHRLQRLTTTHLEAFYGAKSRETVEKDGVTKRRYRPATVDHIHRTLRSALKDAVRAGLIPTNPAANVQRQQDQSVEAADHTVEPFDTDAALAIIEAARGQRNGARFIIALTHGLRQGEALGLAWRNVHLDVPSPYMSIDQQLQRHTWLHGCGDERPDRSWPCGGRRGADCPRRHSGGLVLTQVKSRKGARRLALDAGMLNLLRSHYAAQMFERARAGTFWHDAGLVFVQENGRPLDPRADARDWKRLLRIAGVRETRLHDARHTAATLLLVLEVDPRVVMDLMGWSSPAMLHRYQHVVESVRQDAATRMGTLLLGPGTLDDSDREAE